MNEIQWAYNRFYLNIIQSILLILVSCFNTLYIYSIYYAICLRVQATSELFSSFAPVYNISINLKREKLSPLLNVLTHDLWKLYAKKETLPCVHIHFPKDSKLIRRTYIRIWKCSRYSYARDFKGLFGTIFRDKSLTLKFF